MKRALGGSLLIIFSFFGEASAREVKLLSVERAKVFVGAEGLEVALVELPGQRALIRVTGIKSEIEGKVLEHAIERASRGLRYVTELHGRPNYTLISEEDYGRPQWRLYARGGPANGRSVTFDEARTKAFNTAPLLELHKKQAQSGELAALQRFDRASEQRQQEAELARAKNELAKTCGIQPKVVIYWQGIADEVIKEHSISGYCDGVFEAMADLCSRAAGKDFLRRIREVRCRFDRSTSLRLTGGILETTISFNQVNLDEKIKHELAALKTDQGKTLKQLVLVDDTDVCFADDKRVVILAPSETERSGLSYGDGKTFFHVDQPKALSSGWFFDPRQFNKTNSSSFRGLDLRYYSRVEVDRQKKRCMLTCGGRAVELKLADRPRAVSTVEGAVYVPSPHPREPYTLARDPRGIYYFVDRGTTESTQKDFQVYVGPRGRLKAQKMKDIVSDSEGEIFSTRNGDLRLVLGKSQAFWITKGSRRQELLLLPVGENLGLIYNELGVYLLKKLGVPCDDL